LCLLGNKADLKDQREVTYEEAEAVAKQHSLSFFEVSAKDASNINKAFDKMIVDIYNSVKKPQESKETGKETTPKTADSSSKSDPSSAPLPVTPKNNNSLKLTENKPAETQGESGSDCSC